MPWGHQLAGPGKAGQQRLTGQGLDRVLVNPFDGETEAWDSEHALGIPNKCYFGASFNQLTPQGAQLPPPWSPPPRPTSQTLDRPHWPSSLSLPDDKLLAAELVEGTTGGVGGRHSAAGHPPGDPTPMRQQRIWGTRIQVPVCCITKSCLVSVSGAASGGLGCEAGLPLWSELVPSVWVASAAHLRDEASC